MKNLFDAWKKIKPLIQKRSLALFLDYDGTLTPIVALPVMARLMLRQREILSELSKQKKVKVAVISGRELEDIKKCIRVPGIIYVGNHGLELERAGVRRVHPDAIVFQKLVGELRRRLAEAYAFFHEILIEDKRLSLSVHYRQVPEDKIEFMKTILLKEIGPFLGRSQVVLAEGKKVWEIRPPTEWNKGKTVIWLLGHSADFQGGDVLPIYIGDDVTDEDAFKALKHKGLTVRVTDTPSEPSAALYYLRSPHEVFDFLTEIIAIKKNEAGNGE